MSKKIEPRGTAGEIPVFCRYDEIVPIEKAVENPKNPNTHGENQLQLLSQIIKSQGVGGRRSLYQRAAALSSKDMDDCRRRDCSTLNLSRSSIRTTRARRRSMRTLSPIIAWQSSARLTMKC